MAVSKKQMIAAATEFNKVMGLEPAINTAARANKEKLEKDIRDAASHLEPADALSKETQATLTEMKVSFPGKKEEKKADTKEATKPAAAAGKDKPAATKPKGPGVIASVLEFITKAPKAGIDKEGILAKLEKRFPDRDVEAMKKTVNAQIGGKKTPCRLAKEKKVKISVTEKGKYSIA